MSSFLPTTSIFHATRELTLAFGEGIETSKETFFLFLATSPLGSGEKYLESTEEPEIAIEVSGFSAENMMFGTIVFSQTFPARSVDVIS